MSEATTRADVKAKVESISNIGVVHDYERYASTWSDFLGLYKSGDLIRGWTITLQDFNQEQLTYGNAGTIQRNYTYKVRGLFGVNDVTASEKTAIEIVEDVIEAFDASIDTDSDVEWNFPAQLTIFENRRFGTTLCHYAEITVIVTELT